MRLIDAGKIRYRDMSGGSVPDGVWYTFLDDVEKIPTVKAIPVEWIKKQIEKALSVDSVDLFYVGSLKHLIKEWEKENEQAN